MLSIKSLKILVRLRIVLPELPDDILAHITIILLHFSGNLQLILRRYIDSLSTLSHQVQHKLRDIASGDWDVLDGTSNDVPLCTRDNVCDTIPGIDDCAGESAVGDSVG
jgi:hypothetical protein